jgi:hypothetical protein
MKKSVKRGKKVFGTEGSKGNVVITKFMVSNTEWRKL